MEGEWSFPRGYFKSSSPRLFSAGYFVDGPALMTALGQSSVVLAMQPLPPTAAAWKRKQPPLKLRYPLKVNGWKMIHFLLRNCSFSGDIIFFLVLRIWRLMQLGYLRKSLPCQILKNPVHSHAHISWCVHAPRSLSEFRWCCNPKQPVFNGFPVKQPCLI